eukprot:TRINITY_DN4339_c1_g1_i6.p1 TRINITY_DN4339_c1_g1~~TRINITY_DN4339_c1_g1_i6.p1  ORF type:complete len:216 (-),score=-9.55 TRINITY_DN4339_c1_g1_i6:776-1423(-)
MQKKSKIMIKNKNKVGKLEVKIKYYQHMVRHQKNPQFSQQHQLPQNKRKKFYSFAHIIYTYLHNQQYITQATLFILTLLLMLYSDQSERAQNQIIEGMVQIYFVIYAIPKQPLNYLKLHSLFNKKQYLSSFKKKLGIWRYQIWVLSVSYVLQNEILQHFHNLGMYTKQIRGKQYSQQSYNFLVNYNNQESSQKNSHNSKNKIQVYRSRRKFLAIC